MTRSRWTFPATGMIRNQPARRFPWFPVLVLAWFWHLATLVLGRFPVLVLSRFPVVLSPAPMSSQ